MIGDVVRVMAMIPVDIICMDGRGEKNYCISAEEQATETTREQRARLRRRKKNSTQYERIRPWDWRDTHDEGRFCKIESLAGEGEHLHDNCRYGGGSQKQDKRSPIRIQASTSDSTLSLCLVDAVATKSCPTRRTEHPSRLQKLTNRHICF